MRLRDWLAHWFRRRSARTAATTAPAVADVADVADDPDVDPFDPFPVPVQIEVTDVLDLHTIAPRDVQRVVSAYLEEAHRRGFRSVRLIHGKGRGVQRAQVQAILATTAFVRTWTDAPPAAGGWGATVAHLTAARE